MEHTVKIRCKNDGQMMDVNGGSTLEEIEQ